MSVFLLLYCSGRPPVMLWYGPSATRMQSYDTMQSHACLTRTQVFGIQRTLSEGAAVDSGSTHVVYPLCRVGWSLRRALLRNSLRVTCCRWSCLAFKHEFLLHLSSHAQRPSDAPTGCHDCQIYIVYFDISNTSIKRLECLRHELAFPIAQV